MKVVAFNGSPRKEGNIFRALLLVCEHLEAKGIETEIVQVGIKNVRICAACGQCTRNKNDACVIKTNDFYWPGFKVS